MQQLNTTINTIQSTLDNSQKLHFSWWDMIPKLNPIKTTEAKNNLIKFASGLNEMQPIIWYELCEIINPTDPKQSKENFIDFIRENILNREGVINS